MNTDVQASSRSPQVTVVKLMSRAAAVARKEDLLLKGCQDLIIESPLQLIFRDLFYRLPAFAESHDVFLKLEGFNITGSIKVKTAIGLVEDLEQRGMARPNKTVLVESSSGNLGLALSLVCAIKGYKFICVTDPNANRTTIRGMEPMGPRLS
jgi:cysteine synthase A